MKVGVYIHYYVFVKISYVKVVFLGSSAWRVFCDFVYYS